MTSIVVFDYGFGNVRSMMRALMGLNVDVMLTADIDQAWQADGVVVPGVGAFAACMEGLRQAGGDELIRRRVRAGKAVLGVCVGQQIMFGRGVEHGVHADGLGLIDGEVSLLDAPVVPHMGWNTVEAPSGSRLLDGVAQERFYFVHSYGVSQARDAHDEVWRAVGDPPSLVTWCEYGQARFVAAYERGSLCATQFHPEKSGEAGMRLLRNWVRLAVHATRDGEMQAGGVQVGKDEVAS